MKPELEQISENIRNCYNMTEKTRFEIETVDARELLTKNRLDLGAKLYYVQCYVTGEGITLAKELYCKHIEVMEYQIKGERLSKTQVEESLNNFQDLIETFRLEEEQQPERPFVIVGADKEILDGTHLVACSIYFGKKVKTLCLQEVEGEIFDFKFFSHSGLEQGYLEMMAAAFAFYRKDCVGRYNLGESNRYRRMSDLQKAIEDAGCYMVYGRKIETATEKGWYYIFYSNRRKKLTEELCTKHYEDIKEALALDEKEEKQSVTVSKEEVQCEKVRSVGYRHAKYWMAIKKALHLPTKKNRDGYRCGQLNEKI